MTVKTFRHVCFTHNNPVDNVRAFGDVVRYAVWQLEKAPSTGTLHHQGYVEFKQPLSMKAAKGALGDAGVHLEPRKGTREQAREYCMKADSRVEGPWEHGQWDSDQGKRSDLVEVQDAIKRGMGKREIYEQYPLVAAKYPRFVAEGIQYFADDQVKDMKDFVPRAWQKDLLEILEGEPHDRHVIWVVDVDGAAGKSYLSKYLRKEQKAFYCNGGKGDNIVHAYQGERIAIFDYVRDSKDYVNYGVIEQVKNGMMFSGKYESGVKCYNVPHVVVFSNFEPDRSKFSADRWRVIVLPPAPRVLSHLGGVPLTAEARQAAADAARYM